MTLSDGSCGSSGRKKGEIVVGGVVGTARPVGVDVVGVDDTKSLGTDESPSLGTELGTKELPSLGTKDELGTSVDVGVNESASASRTETVTGTRDGDTALRSVPFVTVAGELLLVLFWLSCTLSEMSRDNPTMAPTNSTTITIKPIGSLKNAMVILKSLYLKFVSLCIPELSRMQMYVKKGSGWSMTSQSLTFQCDGRVRFST